MKTFTAITVCALALAGCRAGMPERVVTIPQDWAGPGNAEASFNQCQHDTRSGTYKPRIDYVNVNGKTVEVTTDDRTQMAAAVSATANLDALSHCMMDQGYVFYDYFATLQRVHLGCQSAPDIKSCIDGGMDEARAQAVLDNKP